MKYVDYNYYKDTYKGKIAEVDFDNLIIKASMIIDRNINIELDEGEFNNLNKKAQEKLKNTTCALIELINQKEESNGKKITSLSIDGVSKSFYRMSSEEYSSQEKDVIKNLPDELTCYL